MFTEGRKTGRFEKGVIWSFGIFFIFGVISTIPFDVFSTHSTNLKDTNVAAIITGNDTYKSQILKPTTRTQISNTYSLTFSIAGDFMFARGVHRKFVDEPAMSLEKLGKNIFGYSDANIVNMEGAISIIPTQKVERGGSFKFVSPSTVVDVLKEYNINAVSLANNHSDDNGIKGFKDTQQILEKNDIKHFGGYAKEHITNVATIKGTNLNLILIGVHTLYETPNITNIIREYKKDNSNRVLIMPHWGREYEFKASNRQRGLAHNWIDAGADIIIGSHPHVIQDVEVYKGAPIIYSLGNFLFDQTERNTGERGVQDGMTLHGKFIKDKLAIYAVPIRLENFQPHLIEDKEKEDKILEEFYKPWEGYSETINGIKMFVF